jgi:transposase
MSRSGFGVCQTLINTTMNSHRYLTTLEDYLRPSLQLLFPLGTANVIFQQDNARPHVANIICDWFANEPFTLLDDWPPYSPDLNVIENVWSHMRSRLRYRRIPNVQILAETLHNVWNNLEPALATRLVDSMANRCRNVIARRGLRV